MRSGQNILVRVGSTGRWVRLYFISFHLLTVIVVLNIFTAFVLEVQIIHKETKRRRTALNFGRKHFNGKKKKYNVNFFIGRVKVFAYLH